VEEPARTGWRALWARRLGPAPDLVAVRRLLLAGLGVVYLIAFSSLAIQVHGLVGSGGILPNERFFAALAERGIAGFRELPTACWWLGCSDGALDALCGLGVAGGAMLAYGALPLPAALMCWGAYLSLLAAGQLFLSYQWDMLLVEAGFLAIWLAPPGAVRPGGAGWRAPPPRPVMWAVRWLLFRLVFGSGLAKLASGDPTWRDLTALAYHYETQPLPAWTSWWAFQLPLGVQKLSTLAVLACELGVPPLYLGPRVLRAAAAALTAGLMLLIGLTGNYGFFNLLTVVLCIALLDDRMLPSRLREIFARAEPAPRRTLAWPSAIPATLVLLLALASLVPLGGTLGLRLDRTPLGSLYGLQGGLRLVNGYGLFATMTTRRPEILIEGSLDGKQWRPYRFRWKPGDPLRAPRFAGPHMPRLDWQLWFAALRGPKVSPWVADFALCLAQGRPDVLALLAGNPFPGRPPHWLRLTLWDYRFSDLATRRRTGAWWVREPIAGNYLRIEPSEHPSEVSPSEPPEGPGATSDPAAPTPPSRSAP
jgi:lipase maturation factor 1